MPQGSLLRCLCYPNLPDQYDDADVRRVIEQVGLAGVLPDLHSVENWDRRLSGGEKQRVSFARALLPQPDWLFMDEASANLDEEAEIHCHRLLDEHLPQTTVLAILHRLTEDRFFTRQLMLENGQFVWHDRTTAQSAS